MELRVIDFGRVSAIRSQSLWHAIAYGVSDGSPPTLSFMTPESPYVSIGLHSDIGAVDLAACERAGLPVYRRMVGGGPVYLDHDQLFFQITVPSSTLPAKRSRAVRQLLAPAVEAFRNVGVDARLDETNEIVVGDQKVCGHAAGQIGGAVLVVGNLITGFDHDAAAAIAKTPNDVAARTFRRMLERYVTAVNADPARFVVEATHAYTSSLQGGQASLRARGGREPASLERLETSDQGGARAREPRLQTELTPYEREKLEELDRKLADPSFVQGEPRQQREPWRIKVKSGVFVYADAIEEAV
ncbi:MAG: hypothetical protein V3S38_02085 [Acidimicrobiia bacterium]